jgi:prepilin signal peptidase PulO-like enzyme (type II secretory pathway)
MNPQVLALDIAAVIVTLVASVIDVRTKKIPNVLTFPAAFIGIILNFALFLSWQKGLLAIAGWFAGVLIMVAFNMFGNKNKMGFGDAKLIGAVGAFLGLKVVIAWLYFAFIYGSFATIKFCSAIPWTHFGKMVKAASMGLTEPLEKEAADNLNAVMNKPIALAPFIAGGTILAVLLMKPTMDFLGFPDW